MVIKKTLHKEQKTQKSCKNQKNNPIEKPSNVANLHKNAEKSASTPIHGINRAVCNTKKQSGLTQNHKNEPKGDENEKISTFKITKETLKIHLQAITASISANSKDISTNVFLMIRILDHPVHKLIKEHSIFALLAAMYERTNEEALLPYLNKYFEGALVVDRLKFLAATGQWDTECDKILENLPAEQKSKVKLKIGNKNTRAIMKAMECKTPVKNDVFLNENEVCFFTEKYFEDMKIWNEMDKNEKKNVICGELTETNSQCSSFENCGHKNMNCSGAVSEKNKEIDFKGNEKYPLQNETCKNDAGVEIKKTIDTDKKKMLENLKFYSEKHPIAFYSQPDSFLATFLNAYSDYCAGRYRSARLQLESILNTRYEIVNSHIINLLCLSCYMEGDGIAFAYYANCCDKSKYFMDENLNIKINVFLPRLFLDEAVKGENWRLIYEIVKEKSSILRDVVYEKLPLKFTEISKVNSKIRNKTNHEINELEKHQFFDEKNCIKACVNQSSGICSNGTLEYLNYLVSFLSQHGVLVISIFKQKDDLLICDRSNDKKIVIKNFNAVQDKFYSLLQRAKTALRISDRKEWWRCRAQIDGEMAQLLADGIGYKTKNTICLLVDSKIEQFPFEAYGIECTNIFRAVSLSSAVECVFRRFLINNLDLNIANEFLDGETKDHKENLMKIPLLNISKDILNKNGSKNNLIKRVKKITPGDEFLEFEKKKTKNVDFLKKPTIQKTSRNSMSSDDSNKTIVKINSEDGKNMDLVRMNGIYYDCFYYEEEHKNNCKIFKISRKKSNGCDFLHSGTALQLFNHEKKLNKVNDNQTGGKNLNTTIDLNYSGKCCELSVLKIKPAYILDPTNSLLKTQKRIRPYLSLITVGVIGTLPTVEVLAAPSILFFGHGNGNNHGIVAPKVALFGCSSLWVPYIEGFVSRRKFDCAIGCLWDVTDGDLDEIAIGVLKENAVMACKCRMKWLNGCAVIVFGW